ncbi:MAG: DUF1295 domain-containing protein [Candidatus Riflebacteria bacterium]|nr:DUF1295 domain-containing protein [Candidatus Riflebacteria bacterium]
MLELLAARFRAVAWVMDRWQAMVNLVLFLVLGEFAIRIGYQEWQAGRFDIVQVLASGKNLIGLVVILARMPHREIEMGYLPQFVALFAFFSGESLIKAPGVATIPQLYPVGKALLCLGIVVVALALLSINTSFGILIARREVRTGGLFRFVRHPMYAGELLKRAGVLLMNACWQNVVAIVVSSVFYILRAVCEERFLERDDEYREYRQRVRYWFCPGLF